MKTEFKKMFIFRCVILVSTLTLSVVACQKAGESGARKKPGSGRNDVVQGKMLNEDLFEKNQEVFKSCMKAQISDLLTEEGFAANTLTGKNLESVLAQITNEKDLKSSLVKLDKDNKDMHTQISTRLSLIKNLIEIKKDLPAKEKFFFIEGLSEALFPLGNKVLSREEVAAIASDFEKSNSVLGESSKLTEELNEIAETLKDENAKSSDNAIHEGQKRLDEKIQELSKAEAKNLANKVDKIKLISKRISQKDKRLKDEYETLSKDLVEASGVLEKKACSQMVIEKSEKNGEFLNSYLQALKLRIDLESVNGKKPTQGK